MHAFAFMTDRVCRWGERDNRVLRWGLWSSLVWVVGCPPTVPPASQRPAVSPLTTQPTTMPTEPPLAAISPTLAEPIPYPTGRFLSASAIEWVEKQQECRRMAWQPGVGRSSEYTRQRHPLAGQDWRLSIADDFDQAGDSQVPGWQVLEPSAVRTIQVQGRRMLRIRGEQNAKAGLELDIPPEMIAGKDVRLELRLLSTTPAAVEALSRATFWLDVRDRTGQELKFPIPKPVQPSPGVEGVRAYWRFQSTVTKAVLCLSCERADSEIVLDAMRLWVRDPLAVMEPADSFRPKKTDSGGSNNWIRDGDFETGQPFFHACRMSTWPNGDPLVTPLNWQWSSETVVGRHCLVFPAGDGVARIGFGHLNLLDGVALPVKRSNVVQQSWHVAFAARSFRPVTLSVGLWAAGRLLDRCEWTLTDQWQRYDGVLRVEVAGKAALADAELAVDVASDSHRLDPCWLDGLILSDGPIPAQASVNARPQVALVLPESPTYDVRNLFDEREEVSLTVRVMGPGKTTLPTAEHPNQPASVPTIDVPDEPAPNITGQLAIDLLDAWDRVVWTRTLTPELMTANVWEESCRWQLPCGWYRVLATWWAGEPNNSPVLSHSRTSLAVMNLLEPVAPGSTFGCRAASGCISARCLALGAGWVRVDWLASKLQSGPGAWDCSYWGQIAGDANRSGADMLTSVALPSEAAAAGNFLSQWLGEDATRPTAMLLGTGDMPPAPTVYRQQLQASREFLVKHAPRCTLIGDLPSCLGALAFNVPASAPAESVAGACGDIAGIKLAPSAIPELREPLLEWLGKSRPSSQPLWDVGVSVQLGGAEGVPQPRAGADAALAAGISLDEPADPVVSASRMVRGMLIRALAGAERIGSEASALAGVALVSESGADRLHEADLSPRPALVAFELMSKLLSNARLVRWLDVPGGARVLLYEKEDGQAIAATWRPFGLSPTPLLWPGLPPQAEVVDCLGMPVPRRESSDPPSLEVDEVVRYVIVPPQWRGALAESLDRITVLDSAAPSP